MMKSGILEYATLNVTFSLLVKARKKDYALSMADFQLNDKSILLDRVQLVDKHGAGKSLRVVRIETIQWSAIESTDYTNLFNAVGQIRLILSVDWHAEQSEGNPWTTSYQLPRSIIQDRAVWVIPTTSEPAFTQVISQSLKFSDGSRNSAFIIEAG